MPQLSMVPVSERFSKELRRLCTEHQVALVFNDTGSLFNRYSSDSFLASASSVTPDAGFSFLGGQVGVCYMSEALYCTDPLKLISTWDGDEFSLASFIEELEVHSKNIKQRLENRDKFHAHLEQVFNDCQVEHKSLHKGYGRFQGNVPLSLARMFKTVDGYKIIAPTDCAISRFLNSLEAE
jgi:glutamate-1-semialdehyde aminotransferase